MLNCPSCKNRMQVVRVKGSRAIIDRCTQCSGLWLDDGEIYSFVDEQEKLEEFETCGLSNPVNSDRNCPHCDISMKSGTLPQFNIVVENCTSCNGLFLDKGELSSVIRNKTVPIPKQRLKTRYKDLNDKSIRRELPDFFLEILDNDETVLWAEKPHFFGYLLTYLIGVIPIVLGAFFAIFSVALKHDKNSIPLFELNLYYTKYIVIFLIVVGSFIYWGYSNVIYALTSKRVIISTGMMGIDFSSIDYSKVTDLSLSVGPVDKILGTGSIYIYTASSDESFSAIATPYSVYKKIKKLTYRK